MVKFNLRLAGLALAAVLLSIALAWPPERGPLAAFFVEPVQMYSGPVKTSGISADVKKLFRDAEAGSSFGVVRVSVPSGSLRPLPPTTPLAGGSVVSTATPGFGQRLHVVAQFERMPTLAERAYLETLYRIRILGAIPDQAFVISVPVPGWDQILNGLTTGEPRVRAIFEIKFEDKLSKELVDPSTGNLALPDHARRPLSVAPPDQTHGVVVVRFFADVPESEQRQILSSVDVDHPNELSGRSNFWLVTLPKDQIDQLLLHDAIKRIEAPPGVPENDMHHAAPQVGLPNPLAHSGYAPKIAQWEPCPAPVGHISMTPRVQIGSNVPPICRFWYFYDTNSTIAGFDADDSVWVDLDGDGNPDTELYNGNGLLPVAGLNPQLLERYFHDLFVNGARDYGEKLFAKKVGGVGDNVILNYDYETGTIAPVCHKLPPSPCDFDGDLTLAQAMEPADGHATMVAGIMHGRDDAKPYAGMAVSGEILSHAVNDETLLDEYVAAMFWGATVSNNSWGARDDFNHFPNSDKYPANSSIYDSLVSGRTDSGDATPFGGRLVIVATVGNDGKIHNSWANLGPGWANARIVNSAKNILSVGNVSIDNADTAAPTISAHPTSGRGPAADGRITPILSAPGSKRMAADPAIYVGIRGPYPSAPLVASYRKNTGTSFAAPIVSGGAAIVQKTYEATCGVMPAPATTRALLIHTARDLTDAHELDGTAYRVINQGSFPGPDYVFGYGLLQTEQARQAAMGSHFSSGRISRGYTEHRIDMAAGDLDDGIKVTLVWDDPPYYPGYVSLDHGVLQNDLDLELIAPGGKRFFPWILNPEKPWAPATQHTSGWGGFVAVEHRDHRNTVEQVFVPGETASAYPGQWRIRVWGTKVHLPDQPFTLVSGIINPATDCGGLPFYENPYPADLTTDPVLWLLFWIGIIILILLLIELFIWMWLTYRNNPRLRYLMLLLMALFLLFIAWTILRWLILLLATVLLTFKIIAYWRGW